MTQENTASQKDSTGKNVPWEMLMNKSPHLAQ